MRLHALGYAGVRINGNAPPGAAYWQIFSELVGAALDALA